jgi:hypothetical protein
MARVGITRLGVGAPVRKSIDFDAFDTKDLTTNTIQGMEEGDFYRRRRMFKRIRYLGRRNIHRR